MYVPALFREDDPAQLLALMNAHPFATLITRSGDAVSANHFPLLVAPGGERGVLRGHMARANPQWRAFGEGEALAIFHGPHAYVSPRWYGPGAHVPTWNYAAIHVTGRARVVDDPEAARALLEAQIARFEAPLPSPWTLAESAMDAAEVRALVGAIVAFEIDITRVAAKLKLSQNRHPDDRAGVMRALAASDHPTDRAVAALMKP